MFAGYHQGRRVRDLPLAQICLLLGEKNSVVSEGESDADNIYNEDSSQFKK